MNARSVIVLGGPGGIGGGRRVLSRPLRAAFIGRPGFCRRSGDHGTAWLFLVGRRILAAAWQRRFPRWYRCPFPVEKVLRRRPPKAKRCVGPDVETSLDHPSPAAL